MANQFIEIVVIMGMVRISSILQACLKFTLCGYVILDAMHDSCKMSPMESRQNISMHAMRYSVRGFSHPFHAAKQISDVPIS